MKSILKFSTKSTISEKLKSVKVGKLIFHPFQNIAQLFEPKTLFGHI